MYKISGCRFISSFQKKGKIDFNGLINGNSQRVGKQSNVRFELPLSIQTGCTANSAQKGGLDLINYTEDWITIKRGNIVYTPFSQKMQPFIS
jgi:hypothetical protein